MIAVLALLDLASAQDRPPVVCSGPCDHPELLARLTDASEIRPEVRFVDGVARTVRMDVPVSGDSPEARARDFLSRFGPLYGLSDPAEELVLDRQRSDGELAHLTFVQRHQGHRVDGGELAVHLIGDRVTSTNGHLRAGLGPVGVPSVSRAEAEAIATETSGLRDVYVMGLAQLVVHRLDGREGTETRLGWEIHLVGADESGPVQLAVAIDAEDGAILDQDFRAAEIDLVVDTVSNSDSFICWFLGGNTEWFDENGPNGSYDPALDAFTDAADAWAFARETYDFFDGFGWTSWDDKDGRVELRTHWGVSRNRATYVTACGELWISDGFAQPDIYAHEFTHAINSFNANLGTSPVQAGALAESYGDVFGALIDGDAEQGDAVEGGFTGPCKGSSGVRDLSNPSRCSHPDHMDKLLTVRAGQVPTCGVGGNDCGFIHGNSAIPSKAAWLLMEGGFHSGFRIDPIGRDKVGRLYFGVLVDALTSQADFQDARDATVAMASTYAQLNLHGFTTDDVCEVKNAFASVGIATGGADTDCDGVSDLVETDNDGDGVADADDNCVSIPNIGQANNDGDAMGNACDPDIDDDGDPNEADNCPYLANADQNDLDMDGLGDLCDDEDGDKRIQSMDNCPTIYNPDQENLDGDPLGDVCDPDDDGDLTNDDVDLCPRVHDNQADRDRDGVGDACDNCGYAWNPDQLNCDGDDKGAVCDDSLDGYCDIDIPVLVHGWVHPLDLVSIRVTDDLWSPMPEGWEVVVHATSLDGTPLRIIDDRGNHVAWVDQEVGTRFSPRASAAFVAGEAVGAFRAYYLEVGPSASSLEQVEIEVEVSYGE